MTVRFTVYGKPFGWQRAGHNGKSGAFYTRSETKAVESIFALSYRAAARGYRFPDDTPLSLDVTAYYKPPKKCRRKYPTVKPDWDNLGKLIGDALNGVAYDDDKCIVDGSVHKRYDDRERTEVTITTVE